MVSPELGHYKSICLRYLQLFNLIETFFVLLKYSNETRKFYFHD